MAKDIALGDLYNGVHDLYLTKEYNDGTLEFLTATHVISFDTLQVPNISRYGDVGDEVRFHFIDSAPEPLDLYTTYTFNIISLSPDRIRILNSDTNFIEFTGTISPDNKLIPIDKDFAIISDGAQVLQKVNQRINTIKGEWVFNKNLGLPYFSGLLGSNAANRILFEEKRAIFEVILKQVILETSGVRNIIYFNSTYDSINRNLKINYKIETTFEEVKEGFFGFDI